MARRNGLQTSVFLRLGAADGDTTPFESAGSIGVTAGHLFRTRPNSALAIGFSWGSLSSKYRANAADVGVRAAPAESAIEITYADTIGQRLTLQPDLQYILRPSGDPQLRDAVVLGMRTIVSF